MRFPFSLLIDEVGGEFSKQAACDSILSPERRRNEERPEFRPSGVGFAGVRLALGMPMSQPLTSWFPGLQLKVQRSVQKGRIFVSGIHIPGIDAVRLMDSV